MSNILTIEFASVSGNVIGRVTVDGDQVAVDPSLESVVEDMAAEDIVDRYADWSNGYIRSYVVDPEDR